MCGLIYSDRQTVINDIQSSLNLILHRGPDNQSYKIRNQSVFGHTRLSFLDLSYNGNQPFISECENYCLVFNGEIYNFKELRKLLQSKQIKFTTNTDTEVLFRGLMEFGIDFASKLDGMFSFVFEDRQENKIYLMRDNFGMKPLYYENNNEGLLVGSELKLFQKSDKNKKAIIDYLIFGYIPEPDTIFSNVKSVPTDKFLVYDLQKKTITQRGWTPKHDLIYDLKHSLELTLTSDVPVATFFSGGFDSTVLSYYAKKKNQDNHCFGLGFRDFDLDETDKQAKVSAILELNAATHHIPKTEIEGHLIKFLSKLEYPTIDGFNTYLLAQTAKKLGYKACISGLGADELFAGYPSFTDHNSFQNWECAKYIPSKLLCSASKLKRLCWLKYSNILGKYLVRRGLFIPEQVSNILGIPVSSVESRVEEHDDRIRKNCTTPLPFYLEQNYYMRGQLLRDADYFSMMNSIEVRMPFLNLGIRNLSNSSHEIILNQRFPKEFIINKQPKNVSSLFTDIKKQGFILPYGKWISEFNLGGKDMKDLCDNPVQNWALCVLERF